MAASSGILKFADGTTSTFSIGQYEIGQAELYAAKIGLRSTDGNILSAAPVLMTRYCAYVNTFRNEKTRPAFDVWDKTLDAIETDNEEPENPTQTEQPDETLQD